MPDIHTESAWARTKRDFQGFVTDTIRFVVWFTFCNVVVVGATTYFSWGHQRGAQLDIGVGAFIVGAAAAFALPLGAIWVIAPVRQRNEARELIVRLQDKPGFPDVVIKTGQPLDIGMVDSSMVPGERATEFAISIEATNRERERRAILVFTAYVQTQEPRPGVWRLSRSRRAGAGPAFIPDPLKLDPQDIAEGETTFVWDHRLDFVLGRDLSAEEAIARVKDGLQLAAKDHLSGVSIEVKVPGTWHL